MQKERKDIDPKDKWDIFHIFESDEMWEEEYKRAEELISKLKAYKGKLSLENIGKCLKDMEEAKEVADKVCVYAGLRANEDATDAEHQGMDLRSQRLTSLLAEAVAFFEPELTALPEKELREKIETPELKTYKHYIENILRTSKYVLSPDKEEMLAKAYEVLCTPSNVFYMADNADMVFTDAVNSKGDSLPLTHGTYISYLSESDRVLRKSAFENLYRSYKALKNTLSAVYTSSLKADIFASEVRGYKDSLYAALYPENIPVEVYTSLIDTVNEALPLLHRYMKLKKKALGVEELHFYDIYAPVVQIEEKKYSFEEAAEIVKKAVEPLGEEYLSVFTKGIEEEGWIDKYENKGKRSGAYSWGCYGTKPYVSLNFNYDIDSVYTLIHEMGHSMHSYYTWKNQPNVYSEYTIFVAEVASTVNEALLTRYFLATEKDEKKRLYYIENFLEQFRTTLFRQTMFAEFELEVHKKTEAGEALSFEDYCNIYMELNKKYYGDALCYDKQIAWEWMRIPHFYTAFYVYQYATGFSSAIALSDMILNKNGKDAYLEFLKKGSSAYSIDILKDAGVDLTKPDTVKEAMKVFGELLEEMEENL